MKCINITKCKINWFTLVKFILTIDVTVSGNTESDTYYNSKR